MQRIELGEHELASVSREVVGHAYHGSVGAMGRGEGVVDVDLAKRRELSRELGVVLLLLGMEADVLEQQHLARLQPAHSGLGDRPDAVGYERDVAPQVLGELAGDGPKRQRRVRSRGPAEVRHHDDEGAPVHQVPKGGDGGANARVVRDLAVCHRNVEVLTHEDAPAGDVDGRDGSFQSRAAT